MNNSFVNSMEMNLNNSATALEKMQEALQKQQQENLNKVAHNIGETGMIMDGVSNSPIKDADELHKLEQEIQERRLRHVATNHKPITKTTKKIGPNELCPCGSGKKFKKCCMGNGKFDVKYERK